MRALGRLVGEAVFQALAATEGSAPYLRPPGAVPEPAFLLACTRCGECVSACPRGAIRLLPASAGAAMGTPYIDPAQRACDLCGRCMPVCPTGALVPIADPRQVRMGAAVIDPVRCWAYQGRICDLCYHRCPLAEEALRMEGGKPVVIRDACTGCGLCAEVCVATPPAVQIHPGH
ncbi:MAG TPA: 4Fe-4S dicluster domain-containing protein [Symbiobacteriaceae bacterium]